jgi:ABC-2 type transport system ATP-binding protein
MIAIVDQGKLVAAGTSDELKSRLGRDVVDVKVRDKENLARAAEALGTEAVVDRDAGHVSLPVSGGADELVAAVQALGEANIALDDVALRRPTLDDVFLALTGHTTHEPTEGDEPGEAA